MPSLVVVARHEVKDVQWRLEIDEDIPKIELIVLLHGKTEEIIGSLEITVENIHQIPLRQILIKVRTLISAVCNDD